VINPLIHAPCATLFCAKPAIWPKIQISNKRAHCLPCNLKFDQTNETIEGLFTSNQSFENNENNFCDFLDQCSYYDLNLINRIVNNSNLFVIHFNTGIKSLQKKKTSTN